MSGGLSTLSGMGAREWAAFGNILRIFSLPLFLGSVTAAYRGFEFAQAQAPTNLMLLAGVVAVVGFVFALLFWNAKGPLVSGNVVVRLLVGLYMLAWVIGTLGFALLFILFVYLFTGKPEADSYGKGLRQPEKPRFAPPRKWRATGRVGPSGAMVYSDVDQDASVGIFDSWLPVQVLDKRNGFAHVVAATGEGGWIDQRTLMEGA